MRDDAIAQWRPFLKWLLVGLVLLAIPYPYYWWSQHTGTLPAEADWYGGGRNHGPWRWEFPGMYLVLVPLYSLFLGIPVAIGASIWRAWRESFPVLVFGGIVVGMFYYGLFHVLASTLFWTID